MYNVGYLIRVQMSAAAWHYTLVWLSVLDLHSIVSRSTARFGYHPIDVLRGIFDVTSFAMDAVLRVYLQSIPTAVFGWHIFVNT